MLETLATTLCVRLETLRLILEPMEPHHADAMFNPLQDDAIYEWISMGRPASLASLRERAKRIAARMSPDRQEAWPNWAVVNKSTSEVIGEVNASIDVHQVCTNFGYYFFSAYWGQGYATEAVMAGTSHLSACGVSRFVATVTAGNIASERVLEKAGYRRTRLLPANDTLRGVPVDDWEFVRNATRDRPT